MRALHHRFTARFLPLLVVGLIACDGGGDAASDEAADTVAAIPPATVPAPAPASSDVCAMLTQEEVRTATGIDAPGTPSQSGGASVCTWQGTTGAAIVQIHGSASAYEDSREAFQDLYEGTAEDVSGVGDRAYWIVSERGALRTGTMSAVKGSRAITAQVLAAGETDLRTATEALARLALDKI